MSGGPIGVGSAQSVSAACRGVAGNIVLAWMLTIPCTAAIAAVAWWASFGLFF